MARLALMFCGGLLLPTSVLCGLFCRATENRENIVVDHEHRISRASAEKLAVNILKHIDRMEDAPGCERAEVVSDVIWTTINQPVAKQPQALVSF